MLSIDTTPGPRALPSTPAGVSAGPVAAATRCLQRLPGDLLRAMVTGLHANADDLVAGALFSGRDSGGCAVGITLRQLAPDAFQFGRVEFWLWHRWRRGVEPDVARRFPQLQQLQRVFDDAVDEVEQVGHDAHPAKAVGLWLAASADAELQYRSNASHHSGRLAESPNRRPRRRARQPPRGHSRPTITARHRAEMGTSTCS